MKRAVDRLSTSQPLLQTQRDVRNPASVLPAVHPLVLRGGSSELSSATDSPRPPGRSGPHSADRPSPPPQCSSARRAGCLSPGPSTGIPGLDAAWRCQEEPALLDKTLAP